MSAALNPFGADIKLSADEDSTDTVSFGIASVAYPIINKTVDYGVFIDASAITTVETADKTKWTVGTAAPVAGTKGAQLTFSGAATTTAFKNLTVQTASKAATAAAQGALALNSAAAADKTAGTVAGQTKQSKLFYIPAATNEDTPAEIVVGFLGALAGSGTAAGTEVEWTEDDAINVNLVLKVSAGPKTFA